MGALQGMLSSDETDYENIEQNTFDNIQRMMVLISIPFPTNEFEHY